MHIVLISNSD